MLYTRVSSLAFFCSPNLRPLSLPVVGLDLLRSSGLSAGAAGAIGALAGVVVGAVAVLLLCGLCRGRNWTHGLVAKQEVGENEGTDYQLH